MATTQISDIVVPAQFTEYVIENSVVSTALFQSRVLVGNAEIALASNLARVASSRKAIPLTFLISK